MKKNNATIARYFRFILSGILGIFSFVKAQECGDAQNWVDCPNCYENTATISGGIVLKDDVQMGDDGDLFAAFDEDCNVRGLAIQLYPPFGPYEGTPVYEMQIRGDTGDLISFQYYDASEDEIYKIVETYEFSINDIIGDVTDPENYNIAFVNLTYDNVTTTGIDINYESNTEISGFQFGVDGVDVTDAGNGAAEAAGFTVFSDNNIVLGFSIGGATILPGSGTLVSLEFYEISGDTNLEVIDVIISGPDGASIPSSGPGSVELPSSPCDTVEDACGNCGGDCEEYEGEESGEPVYYVICGDSDQNDSIPDCMGVCEGPANYDECGICDGNGPEEHYDCDGICIAEIDCKNECGGSAELDDCDVCTGINGYKPGTCYDCNGAVYGSAYIDLNCGNGASCVSGDTGLTACIQDCAGEWDGNIVEDECGVCGGNNSSCTDCNGDVNGIAEYDNCSICDSDASNNCIQDCAGVWGGAAVDDECGVCRVPDDEAWNTTCTDFDCSGEWDGNIVEDECGVCGGNSSSCTDCNGDVNGIAEYDNCSICDSDASNNCIQDCAGEWGGAAVDDECGVCGGDNSSCTDCNGVVNGSAYIDLNCGSGASCVGGDSGLTACIQDCAGEWGGTSNYDECGICGGDGECDTVCAGIIDCFGECSGSAVEDNCEVCRVPDDEAWNTTCLDCAGVPNGSAVADNCGTCDSNASNNCVKDCAGEWGGSAVEDSCGICGGDNTTCLDCAGMTNGSAIVDNCGTCDSDASNNCIQDCSGVWGGSAVEDNCGVCDSDSENNCDFDCSGIWGGSAVDDACGVCRAPDDEAWNTTCTDCNGDINGSAYVDLNCGSGASCVGGNTVFTACEQDCAGEWGGNVVFDECGVCGGDNSTCTDCYGAVNGSAYIDLNCGSGASCVGGNSGSTACIQDCAGQWGGNVVIDECGTCGGNGPEKDYNCDGNCIASGDDLDLNGLDCAGICGGYQIPSFNCPEGNLVCNPAECSLDIATHLIPDQYGISRIFPNPFNPVTQVQYEISQYGQVKMQVYDLRGREVVQLINEHQNPGHYAISWNAENHASGMYFIEMVIRSGEYPPVFHEVRKVLYMK